MLRLPLTLALVLLSAGCQQPAAPEKPASDAAASASAAPPAPPAPPAATAKARKVSEAKDYYEFQYSYPAAAAAIPALRDWLEADLARKRSALAAQARDAAKESEQEKFPFNPYMETTQWQVVTNLTGWLSLSAREDVFEGGAHGNSAFETILWDKAASQRRTATGLFTSKAALKAAVLKEFCTQLARQRLEKRGGVEMGSGSDDPYNACVDPLEQVVILGSKSRQGFDRIGFLIAPYNAGPYAEGSYEVTLPITAAVLAAVKPEYKAAFVAP